MTGKTLKINIELPVREEYVGLADIIAIANGWTAETGKAPEVYAQEDRIKPELVNQLKIIIQDSLQRYYGLSQDALISQALTDYNNSVKCEVSFLPDEE